MMMFLDTALVALARDAAGRLAARGEDEAALVGPAPAKTPFLICRGLLRGRMPLGKVELDGETYYLCVDTGLSVEGR
jgi:hypothetical protein